MKIYSSILRNVAHRQAAVSRWEDVKQSSLAWNTLDDYFLFPAWHIMKISWKSIHRFCHDITNKHESRKMSICSDIERLIHIIYSLIN